MGRRRRAPKPAATADGATSAAGETDEKKSTAGSKSQVAIMKMAKDIAELELPCMLSWFPLSNVESLICDAVSLAASSPYTFSSLIFPVILIEQRA